MKNLTQSSTFSIDEQTTKKIDSLFNSVSHSSSTNSIADLREKRLGELEQSGQILFAIGEKARLGFWNVMIDTYTERAFLFSVQGLSAYINSFSKYLQFKYGIPKSSASADTKVVKMLEPGDRREVLDKPIGKLNSYLRLFSTAPEKWHKILLDGIEDLATYSVDDLKSYFKPIKDDNEKWHLKLLGDIDKIAEKSAEIIAKLGKDAKSKDIIAAYKQSVDELVEEYTSKTDSTDTDDEKPESKESGE